MDNRITTAAGRLPSLVHPSALSANLGQCGCGQPIAGLRYTADRAGNKTITNLPCSHTAAT